MPKTAVDTALPIEFSEVCEVLWGSPTTNGKSFFGASPTTGAFARAVEQGGTFNVAYVGNKDRLSNFRGYNTAVQSYTASGYPTVLISGVAWTSGSNILNAPDGVAAWKDMTTAGSPYQIWTKGFNFAIPTNATIISIDVVPRFRDEVITGTCYLHQIELDYNTHTTFSNDQMNIPIEDNTGFYTQSWTMSSAYPSQFTPAMLNDNSLFTLKLSFSGDGTIYVDSVQLVVTYTTSGSAPTAPTLSVGTITSTSVALSWTAPATADAYTIWWKPTSSGTYSPIELGNVTSYTVSGLTASTSYDFYVVATNAYGSSPNSNVITQSTSTPQTDTTPPSIPTNLSGIGYGTSVNLFWTVSTDNVGVTGYNIFRDNVNIGTSNIDRYGDNTTIENTWYTYKVQAFDAAGNLSEFSTPVTINSEYII